MSRVAMPYADEVCDSVDTETKVLLTFVLLRRPFEPSIQMYSARTLPFWSKAMYLAN